MGVGDILSIDPVVPHSHEQSISPADVLPIPMETIDKSLLLKSLKLSFTSRTYESLSYAEIPSFLTELSDLRKAVYHLSVGALISSKSRKINPLILLLLKI